MNTSEGQTQEPVKPKPVKERDNLDLLELVCQLHTRACCTTNKEMHDAYVEARKEMESRLAEATGWKDIAESNANAIAEFASLFEQAAFERGALWVIGFYQEREKIFNNYQHVTDKKIEELATPPLQPLGIDVDVEDVETIDEILDFIKTMPTSRDKRLLLGMVGRFKVGYAVPPQSSTSGEEKEQDIIGLLEYAFKEGHFAGRQRPNDNFYKCLDNFKNSKLIKDIISTYKISSLSSEEEAIGKRKFTLKEALDIWQSGYEKGYADEFGLSVNPSKQQYFKDKFDINL